KPSRDVCQDAGCFLADGSGGSGVLPRFARGGQKGAKGALRMKWGVQLIKGLAVIGWLLAGIVSTVGVVSLPTGVACAPSASSIVVEGNRRVEASTVRSYFRPGPGGQIGPQQIDEAYKALFATGLFQDVRINTVGGRIVVTLIENPVINRIAFEGNSK